MKSLRLLVLLAGIALLSACVQQRPLTFEEQQLQDAKQQCEQEATSMNPEYPLSSNPLWSSYFVMCMNRFGYSDSEINKLWY